MLTFNAKTPFADLGNGITRREGVMADGTPASEMKFAAGAFGQLHKRPCSQRLLVISGTFELTVGNEIHIVSAGETQLIPAAAPFGCFCLTAGLLLEMPL